MMIKYRATVDIPGGPTIYIEFLMDYEDHGEALTAGRLLAGSITGSNDNCSYVERIDEVRP